MNRTSLKKYRKWRRNSAQVVWHNPVLVQGLAMPFAIAASTSLMNGVVLSGAMLGTILIPTVLRHNLGVRFEDWLRPVLYSTANMLFLWFFVSSLSGYPAVIDSLGIYLPITAVNTITMRMVSGEQVEAEGSLTRSFLSWLGFALVICFISAGRELIGAGTIWGIAVQTGLPALTPVLYPFSGFIIVGFLAAALKGADRLTMRLMARSDGSVGGEAHE